MDVSELEISAMNASKRADAREALLIAAQKLFSERSYAEVGTRDLAEAAGVNLGAIQYHFGSKADLFILAVKELVASGMVLWNSLIPIEACVCAETTAAELSRFIRGFLQLNLRTDEGARVCRIVYREIFSDSVNDQEFTLPLIDAIAAEFTAPLQTRLSAAIERLQPESPPQQRILLAESILAQCTSYVTRRRVLERVWERNLGDSELFEDIVLAVTSFSLRALGCDEALIKRAFQAGVAYPLRCSDDSPDEAVRTISR